MKKLLIMAALVVGIIGISIVMGYPQQKDEILLKKQTKAEVVADSDQYIIGAEDVLYIHIWKEEALSKTITVRMDGKISLPLIDEIQAAGLTPLKLGENLIERYKEFVDIPNISVMVMEANSFKVFISGQVKKPGVYRLRNETSLLQIISLAEGFTEWANQKEIIIIRKEKGQTKRIVVNYKNIISGKDLNSNLLLKSGDTVIVP